MRHYFHYIFILFAVACLFFSCGASEGSDFNSGFGAQSLYQNEVNPTYVQSIQASSTANVSFDASLEEIFHMLTDDGWGRAYPTVFGRSPGTEMMDCMDTARGGQFLTTPSSYPDGAWYTYEDTGCDYNCMGSEYIYWSMSSMLGAQDNVNRAALIQAEWQLSTRAEVIASDNCMATIIQNETYKLPNLAPDHLPDGTYDGFTIEVSSTLPSFVPTRMRTQVTKAVYVFDIPIIASSGVSNNILIHAGKVMAKYLDRNEDGTADNADVVSQLVSSQATVLLALTEEEFSEITGEGDD